MQIPVLSVEACHYKDLPCNSKVFNKNTLDYYLWIHLPPEFGREFTLFEMIELQPESKAVKDFFKFIDRQPKRPWIRTITKILNLDIGYHLYRLCFVHDNTGDVASLYFNYTIQDDHPYKPYVYMNREEGETCESNLG